MKRGRGSAIREEIKVFLAGKKKGQNQTNQKKEEKLSYLLSLCPSGLLATLIQNTPGLHEKEIFTSPSTPFGEYDISSYMKLIEFLALSRPDEYDQRMPSKISVTKKAKEENNTALKQRSDRMTPLSRLFEDVRDPMLWEAQSDKIQQIVKLCEGASDAEIAGDRAQYIIQRSVNGVFSDHLYKSIASASVLVQMTTHNQSQSFRTLILEKVHETLHKIMDASQNSISRGRVADLEGILSQKLYVGALLLFISLQLIDHHNPSEETSKDLIFQFEVLDNIYTHCASLRGWCFSLMCVFLSNLQESTNTTDTSRKALLALVESICTAMQGTKSPAEYKLLASYLYLPMLLSDLSAETRDFLEANDMLHEKGMAGLLACVKTSQGIFAGHDHIHRHPILKDFSKLLHRQCANQTAEIITQHASHIRKHILEKLDFGKKVELIVGKFFCDTVCHCVLSFSIGQLANQTLFEYYTFSLEKFGNYALPAVKIVKSQSTSTKTQEILLAQASQLITQFEDLVDVKYSTGSNELSMDDFTIDSTDDEEDPDAAAPQSQITIDIENQAKEKRSYFANTMRSHIIRMLHQFALADEITADTLQTIITFFIQISLSSVTTDDSVNKLDVSHRLACINAIASLVGSTIDEKQKEKSDATQKGTSTDSPSKDDSKLPAILLSVISDCTIDARLNAWKSVYCECVKLAGTSNIDEHMRRLCVLFAVYCAWEDSGQPTNRRSESIMTDMAIVVKAMEKMNTNNTKDDTREGSSNAFQRLYGAMNGSIVAQYVSRAMESVWQTHYAHFSFHSKSNLCPILMQAHCRGQTIPGLFVKEEKNKKGNMKKPRESFSESVDHNVHTLRLLALIFDQLSQSTQALMVFRWIAYFYTLASYPDVKHAVARSMQSIFETLVGKVNCVVYFSDKSHAFYADAPMQNIVDTYVEIRWCEVLALFRTVLRTQTKHPEHFRWVKEICGRMLKQLYSGMIYVQKGDISVKKTEKQPPLVASLQKFFVEMIECKSFPTQGKKHFMSCMQQNVPLSTLCVLPGLLDYVRRICHSKEKTPSTFDFQCLDLVCDSIVQILHKIDKSDDTAMKSGKNVIRSDCVDIFAADTSITLPVICSKKFLENCGPTVYRLLLVLKKAEDDTLSAKISTFQEQSMKYIETHRIEVQPKQLRKIRNYIGL